jgi:hypothetical protein
MKIVVFDLDETLGYFVEFGVFWDCLIHYLQDFEKKNFILTQKHFNLILDLYPEFLRPNIINILNYLKNKKFSKCCHSMMIYTNNQAPKKWAKHIISYFDSKINYKIFDRIISAFKVNGEQMEVCRTTHDKTYHDLVKCTKIPPHSEVCFLDDCYYPEMSKNNVFYINVKPYVHDLNFDLMLSRFMKSEIYSKIITKDTNFKIYMNSYFKTFNFPIYEKTEEENNIDKILSKQIMVHLQEFFNKNTRKKIKSNNVIHKTRKYKIKKQNKTRKIH